MLPGKVCKARGRAPAAPQGEAGSQAAGDGGTDPAKVAEAKGGAGLGREGAGDSEQGGRGGGVRRPGPEKREKAPRGEARPKTPPTEKRSPTRPGPGVAGELRGVVGRVGVRQRKNRRQCGRRPAPPWVHQSERKPRPGNRPCRRAQWRGVGAGGRLGFLRGLGGDRGGAQGETARQPTKVRRASGESRDQMGCHLGRTVLRRRVDACPQHPQGSGPPFCADPRRRVLLAQRHHLERRGGGAVRARVRWTGAPRGPGKGGENRPQLEGPTCCSRA
mmetsp:Transcript_34498/g.78018  ORF Transcript_34498/g.78018 Transcript_34498/m.78018 type:complete len:275 (+) Transcript_34498:263-1087(+)